MSSSSKSSEPQLEKTDQTNLKLHFLYDIKKRKIVLAEARANLVDILFGFLGFPISSLSKLEVGAMPQICKSLASLEGDIIQPGFNNCEFFELKPTREGWHNRVLTLLNGIPGDDFKDIPLFLCRNCTFEIRLIPYYVTTDPATLCGTCRNPMDKEVPYDHGNRDDRGIVARGSLRFLIFDDMKMKPASDYLDTFDLVKGMGFNWGELKKKELTLTSEMTRSLLKSCVEKKTVLNELFLEELMKDESA
ncbi:uncharacterized protein LOC133713715 [Rosa rugosa]|uniref:uncharacterized protein LOC133713715 n=1 Tax=Rosa rugosa TaxID=74645 RepID=UPI002B403641|nr:uncharacterized protein LOC133713715 [Rosa rugosa]XP_061995730.1 uncharacterized protein LOC133713715 [Rosa rugosa]